jgi:excisionase family DNA binding protein
MPRTKIKPDRQRREKSTNANAAPAPATTSEVLTLAEAAAFLRVTEQDVLRLVREQGLPGRAVGEDWRFLKAAVEGWLGTPAPDPRKFWETHFGALKDDPYLEEMLKEIYRRRGRPEDGVF